MPAHMKRSGQWLSFGSTYFRRQKLYSMAWDYNSYPMLDGQLVAAAPYGGPVAVTAEHGTRKVATVTTFSANGNKIGEACLPADAGAVHSIGWTSEEHLLIITASTPPQAFLHDFNGLGLLQPHSIGTGDAIAMTKHFTGGAVVLTQDNTLHLLIVADRGDIRATELVLSVLFKKLPACIEVIPPEFSCSEDTEVLLAPAAGERGALGLSVASMNDGEVHDTGVAVGGIVASMVMSQNCSFIALFTTEGVLKVLSADLSAFVLSLAIGSAGPPQQMVWCRDAFVVLSYSAEQCEEGNDEAFGMVVDIAADADPRYEIVPWGEDYRAVLVGDCDGIRVTTHREVFMLDVVPPCLVDIFGYGTTAPAARLCEAQKLYADGQLEGLTLIRSLAQNQSTLTEAIEHCIEAASLEFEPASQEPLLQAAAFGKGYCKAFDVEYYTDSCKRLRILNAVRVERIGIPISLRQYKRLSGEDDRELRALEPGEAQVLVDRLVNRKMYQTAMGIAESLHMRLEKILVQWAQAKVAAKGPSDEEIRTDINGILAKCHGVGFSDAALMAFTSGRPNLAVMLLNDEPRAASKVSLLLQVQQDDLALDKAVGSGDPDLLYTVLLKMMKTTQNEQLLFNKLRAVPAAHAVFERGSFASATFRGLARRYYEASGLQHLASIETLWRLLSLGDPTGTTNITAEDMEEVSRLFAQSHSGEADAKAAKQHAHLLEKQEELSTSTGNTQFLNQTVVATIGMCYGYGKDDEAESLRQKFNIPEKKFWSIKLRALCEKKDWDAVDKLGAVGKYNNKGPKSPIGYLPFVQELAKYDRKDQAAQFIAKLPDVIQRIELYVSLNDFQRAVEEAVEEESPDLLRQIRARAKNPTTIDVIDKYIRKLSK